MKRSTHRTTCASLASSASHQQKKYVALHSNLAFTVSIVLMSNVTGFLPEERGQPLGPGPADSPTTIQWYPVTMQPSYWPWQSPFYGASGYGAVPPYPPTLGAFGATQIVCDDENRCTPVSYVPVRPTYGATCLQAAAASCGVAADVDACMVGAQAAARGLPPPVIDTSQPWKTSSAALGYRAAANTCSMGG